MFQYGVRSKVPGWHTRNFVECTSKKLKLLILKVYSGKWTRCWLPETTILTLVAVGATRVWVVVHQCFAQTFQAYFTILTLVAVTATWVWSWTKDLRYQVAGLCAYAVNTSIIQRPGSCCIPSKSHPKPAPGPCDGTADGVPSYPDAAAASSCSNSKLLAMC